MLWYTAPSHTSPEPIAVKLEADEIVQMVVKAWLGESTRKMKDFRESVGWTMRLRKWTG
jgi:hypothetical protein